MSYQQHVERLAATIDDPASLWLSAIVTGLLLVLFLGGCYETWSFATGHFPITHYLRAAIHSWPPAAFIVAVVVGLVLGHLYWR